MAKYWTFLWQIYLCTIIFCLPCLCDIPLNTPKCSNGKYGIETKEGKLICKLCSLLPNCPSSLGLSIACGDIVPDHTNIHCVQCVLGKNFSSVHDNSPCQTCKSLSCHIHEEVIGSCKVDKDTSSCSGMCKKGSYSSGETLDDCQPCSFCPSNNSSRVQKCKDDGLPLEKQCEMGSPVVPSKKQQHNKVEGCKFYGHPVMFGSFVVAIVILVLILAVVVFRRKFQKKERSSVEVPLNDVTSNVDSGVAETDSYDGHSDLPSVRKRKSSAGSSEQKVSFSRQNSNSNSNTGSDLSDERSVQSPVPVNEPLEETDVFEEKPSQAPERKRTLSGSSGRRNRISFSRQISNPEAEDNDQKPFHKRSMTFSSFTTILPGQKIGTTEETTSLLSSTDCNDNDIFPQVVALPAETSSSTAPHRLSGGKIGDLNAETHQLLCRKLNRDVPNKDWRTLAGRMNYTTEQVKEFAQAADPTDKLLDCWGTGEGHDVARLIELVKGMNRDDVVELLESQPDPT